MKTRRTATVISALSAAALLSVMLVSPSQAEPTQPAAAQHHGPDREKVIFDADMGQLNDDAVAMFMLLQSKKVDVLGVTVVSGNTWVEEGTAYTLRQLELVKQSGVPVVSGGGDPVMGSRQATLAAESTLFGGAGYRGAYSRTRPPSYTQLANPPYKGYASGKPRKEAAAQFIAEQVKRYPNQVTLFVVGPATNVALAVRLYPEIVPLVKQVIYMGGAIDIAGNSSESAEFNWWFDPEAIKITLRTPFKKQLVVPNDIAEQVFYTKAEYDRIVAAPVTPLTQMFRDLQGPRFASNPNSRSFVWDALTAGVFLDPSIATRIENRNVDVDTTFGPDYGRSLGYPTAANRAPLGTQTVQVLFDINRTAFWNLYVDLMTRSI